MLPNNTEYFGPPQPAFQIEAYTVLAQPESAEENVDDLTGMVRLNSSYVAAMNTSLDNNYLTQHLCDLRGAVLQYRLRIDNNTATFVSPSWEDDRIVKDMPMGRSNSRDYGATFYDAHSP